MLKFSDIVQSSIEIIRMSCNQLQSDWLDNRTRLIYTREEYAN